MGLQRFVDEYGMAFVDVWKEQLVELHCTHMLHRRREMF
jgi:hypothetical protein